MTIPMPEPVAVAFLAECGNVAYTGHLEGPYKRLRELSIDGRRGASLALITTTQAEAYADARVREALELAAQTCENQARASSPLDGQSFYIALGQAARAIRALIPPLPGPVDP